MWKKVESASRHILGVSCSLHRFFFFCIELEKCYEMKYSIALICMNILHERLGGKPFGGGGV